MKEYLVKRLPDGAGRLDLDGVFDPAKLPAAWRALDEAAIDAFPWDENGYRPASFARLGWNEGGLHVLLYSFEPVIRAEVADVGGSVCEDSCLEFFVEPFAGMAYLNFEITPKAVLHIGWGEGRHARTVFKALPFGMNPVSSRHEGGWWAVSYTVPNDFLRGLYGKTIAAGLAMRGNFYKCGDRTAHVHYGMWHPYDLPRPDFHRPELFASLVLNP